MMHNKIAQIIYCYYCYKTTVGCGNSYRLGDQTISTRYINAQWYVIEKKKKYSALSDVACPFGRRVQQVIQV